jgi:uncharacterized cupin superfamily protein
MPKVDLSQIEQSNRTGYPAPCSKDVAGRFYRRVGEATGLKDIGISHCVLEPGAWSSQRHWHEGEDELLVMLEGEAVLVEDEGRTPVRPGDILAWPAGVANGHHLVNESDSPCRFVVVGGGSAKGGGYSDIDMIFTPEGDYRRKDGTPYEAKRV